MTPEGSPPGPCYECGEGGITLPDSHGHYYCGSHLKLWDSLEAPTPRQLRDAANGKWPDER